MGRKVFVAAVGCLSLLVLVIAGRSGAYGRWADGCDDPGCHGSFSASPYTPPSGGFQWPSDLHTAHAEPAYMFTDCDLCHRTGDNKSPDINLSDGTSANPGFIYGCMGCHGRVTGGSSPEGHGLIVVHRGVAGSGCEVGSCHTAVATPVGESVAPPYHGSTDTVVDEACNLTGGEDFSGDGLGLDNDGDGLRDGFDADCGGAWVFFDGFESGDVQGWSSAAP